MTCTLILAGNVTDVTRPCRRLALRGSANDERFVYRKSVQYRPAYRLLPARFQRSKVFMGRH